MRGLWVERCPGGWIGLRSEGRCVDRRGFFFCFFSFVPFSRSLASLYDPPNDHTPFSPPSSSASLPLCFVHTLCMSPSLSPTPYYSAALSSARHLKQYRRSLHEPTCQRHLIPSPLPAPAHDLELHPVLPRQRAHPRVTHLSLVLPDDLPCSRLSLLLRALSRDRVRVVRWEVAALHEEGHFL